MTPGIMRRDISGFRPAVLDCKYKIVENVILEKKIITPTIIFHLAALIFVFSLLSS